MAAAKEEGKVKPAIQADDIKPLGAAFELEVDCETGAVKCNVFPQSTTAGQVISALKKHGLVPIAAHPISWAKSDDAISGVIKCSRCILCGATIRYNNHESSKYWRVEGETDLFRVHEECERGVDTGEPSVTGWSASALHYHATEPSSSEEHKQLCAALLVKQRECAQSVFDMWLRGRNVGMVWFSDVSDDAIRVAKRVFEASVVEEVD